MSQVTSRRKDGTDRRGIPRVLRMNGHCLAGGHCRLTRGSDKGFRLELYSHDMQRLQGLKYYAAARVRETVRLWRRDRPHNAQDAWRPRTGKSDVGSGRTGLSCAMQCSAASFQGKRAGL
jgi:hypothetical protein